ncbi:hypothetical protein MASR2M8_10930 [Opitutaceae bacterium]
MAVVIGGTGELCGAMAEGLAGAGAEVVLVGRSEEKAKTASSASPRPGARAGSLRPRPTARAERETPLANVLKRSGRVDIVINGAGINSATLTSRSARRNSIALSA